ncbi:MAG TPA: STAS domain-containing protein [Rhodocyclaceae bacterium]|nr:STAS domain-containing protein [Rhodocyclaceae bacterium]
MGLNLIDNKGVCRLVFDGSLTHEFAGELDDLIVDALRRYSRFEMDLSGVREIDLCGLHLLRMLESVAGDNLTTLATSPVVDHAQKRLLASGRWSWLRGRRVPRDGDGHHAEAA